MVRRCNKSPKYMSEYEHDLTWMAMRYAIGRHTIAAHSICCDRGKNVYGRLSQKDCEYLSYALWNGMRSLQYYGRNQRI